MSEERTVTFSDERTWWHYVFSSWEGMFMLWLMHIAIYVLVNIDVPYKNGAPPPGDRHWPYNVVIVGPVYVAVYFYVAKPPTHTDWYWDLLRLVVAIVIYDFVFWLVHRALHTDTLFRNIHYYHHQWRYNLHPVSALDCHPFEHVILNVAPLLFALWLTGMSRAGSSVVLLFAPVLSQNAHMDYRTAHGAHHLHRTCNFGGFGGGGLADALFGTECSKHLCKATNDEDTPGTGKH